MSTTQLPIQFVPKDKTRDASEASKMGRKLVADSDLGQYIAYLRKNIGRTYLDGSLYVKLYQELSREPGQTVLRNWRRVEEKVENQVKSLEGKVINIGDLRSYGIQKDRFVLYMPRSGEGERNSLYVTIAQFTRDITGEQQEFLKRVVLRATRPPPDEESDSREAVQHVAI